LSSYLCRVDALKQLKKEKEREGAKKKKREREYFSMDMARGISVHVKTVYFCFEDRAASIENYFGFV
jgi:hypothetical protein